MKLKLALATATAMGLLVAAGHAGGNNATVLQAGSSNTASVDQHGIVNIGTTNKTYLSQTGNGNSAVILQDGTSNRAGADETGGTYNHRMRQIGDNNSIDIDQAGNVNYISFHTPISGQTGIVQDGSRNVITVDQDTTTHNTATAQNGNEIRTVLQTSLDGEAATTNQLTVIQNGGATPGNWIKHSIGRVSQDHTGGAANAISVTQTGSSGTNADQGNDVWSVVQRQGGLGASGNAVTISQDGRFNLVGNSGGNLGVDQRGKNNAMTINQTGSGNVINRTDQIADGGIINTANITQNGAGNYVHQVYQNTNTSASDPSSINATFIGAGNGSAGLVGNRGTRGGLTGFAAQVFAPDSILSQTDGGDNSISLTVNGNDNQFGLIQSVGDGNAISGSVTGNGNAAGVNQLGSASPFISADNNVTDYVQTGDGNNLGVYLNGSNNGVGVFAGVAAIGLINGGVQQLGNDNDARYRAGFGAGTSSSNKYAIKQNGNRNEATGEVDGGDGNSLAILQDGDDNRTNVTQTGGNNTAGISITGDDNGAGLPAGPGVTNGLAGAAGTLAAANSLSSGQIVQDGFGNSAGLTISSSSLNQFAFLQDGDNNQIVGSVSGAGGNSAAMVQIGNSNVASFTQSGGGNMVSVNQ